MGLRNSSDAVSLAIKACHKSEEAAEQIYHKLAEKHEGKLTLDDGSTLHLSDEQIEEFVERYSSEVEPTYWESKRRKH